MRGGGRRHRMAGQSPRGMSLVASPVRVQSWTGQMVVAFEYDNDCVSVDDYLYRLLVPKASFADGRAALNWNDAECRGSSQPLYAFFSMKVSVEPMNGQAGGA